MSGINRQTAYHELLKALDDETTAPAAALKKISALHDKYEDLFCVLLFEIITHISFTSKVAVKHWEGVQKHYTDLNSSLKRNVGLRVAILDYFINVNKQMQSPLLIEFALFEQAQTNALIDPLTGLYNRRHFNDVLAQEIGRAKRYNSCLSIVFFDLDYFKQYNDQNGHIAGDIALKKIAQILEKSTREIDTCFRYGGEEFIILCPQTKKPNALVLAERIRARVEETAFPGAETMPQGKITVSGGVASLPGDADTAQALIKASDDALYRAKRSNRNNIQLYFMEQRAFQRIKSTVKISYQEVSNSYIKKSLGVTKNISAGGVLFETDIPLHTGKELELNFMPKRHKRLIKTFGRVVRVEDIGDGKYDVGIFFIGLSEKQIAHLIKSVT